MDPNVNYFHAICPHLPEKLLQGLRSAPVDDLALDNLVRLINGAESSPHSTPDVQEEWSAKQASVASALSSLTRSSGGKRTLDDSKLDPITKRPRLSSPDPSDLATPSDADPSRPIFTLQPISTTAPIRKKVDLNIREKTLVLINASTKVAEAPPIPLSAFRRAFLLPTRGKTKPHWTVVVLSSDSQPFSRGKQVKGTVDENPQVIFGIDAKLTTPLNTTTYDADGIPTTITHPKGSETYPILRDFLTHLGIPLLEPDPNLFKSAVPSLGKNANPDGIPGIEAYRSAKPGSLWFMREGVLWGESKPCEFWSVEDLIGRTEGLRIIGGTGKTCSVVLTRRSGPASPEGEDRNTSSTETKIEELEDDVGEETEFSMIDSKEKEGIEVWVKQHHHLFGSGDGASTVAAVDKSEVEKDVPKGLLTIHKLGAETDSSDEDFTMESDEEKSDGNSDSEGSESETEDESEEENQDGEGGDSDDDASAGGESEEEELDPKHHPLLRAGTLPRMSKAAMDMAVTMVMGHVTGADDEEEVDELME